MDGMVTFGRASLLCTLLLCFSLQVCWAIVTVTVTPKVEVIKGESASLPCTFIIPNSPNNIVEWFIEEGGTRKRVAFRSVSGGEGKSDEGTRLSDRVTMGRDFSLTISPVTVEDQLPFYCQVTAGPAGVGEAITQLKVFFAPEMPEVTGSNQAISVGDSSTQVGQCVSHNGHPQPRIIWFQDSKPLPEVKDNKEKVYMVPSVVKEASGLFTITSTLMMQPQKADKDSVYHCTVEYSMPNDMIKQIDSDTFSLTLNYPSETATFVLSNTEPIREGDEVKMMCETDGNPQPEFDFSKDGINIKEGVAGGLLTLKSVKRSDAGVYKCMATDFDNLDADLNGEVILSVHYIDPMSVRPAGPLSTMTGDMVELQCKTKASDSHTVQWKKGSTVLSQTGVLSLKSVTFAEAGEYSCVGAVPSVLGLTAKASVNLTVSGKPEIDAAVDGMVEKEGDMVTLSCSAHGHPAPQFTWTPSGKESVSVKGNKVVSMVMLEASAAVLMDGVTCEASNDHGAASQAFKVTTKQAVDPNAANDTGRGNHVLKTADKQQGGSSGVVIAVVVCVLMLLLLVALLYFLNKKGKLPCSKKDNKEVESGNVNNDIVVEMKTEKANEEAVLLNKPAAQQ
ncbi:basal cell adhesion molecule-like isoform X1 [Oncorhynchus tshawytscha]|uniref:Ig-like domain-containing protein n=1 Tax=Oncorhynchus tshawytscha TaxID=74940 RepID=A0AAZ3S649_ONCTS|nr:basal cell adhesion molecule-like isoform X1 [Oncorhynchus tshawytscha]